MTVINRLAITWQLIFYSLFPPAPLPFGSGGSTQASPGRPRDVAAMDRFLTKRGDFEVFFAGGLPLAAPFMLFRLKRQGYSGCSVKAADGGLYLRGRR